MARWDPHDARSVSALLAADGDGMFDALAAVIDGTLSTGEKYGRAEAKKVEQENARCKSVGAVTYVAERKTVEARTT